MSCLPAVEAKVGVRGTGFSTHATSTGRADPTGRLERLPLLTQVGVHAALDALGGAPGGDDMALVVATSHGPAESMAEFVAGFRARGHARGNPFLFPNVLYNAVAGEVAIRGGIRGPNITLTAGGLCGAASLEVALLLLRTGRARRVLVLAVEHGGPLVRRAYGRLRRRGFGRTPPVSQHHPLPEDTASALLLDPDAAGSLSVRRARTGYALSEQAFSEFVARAREGLDVSRLVRLEGKTPASLDTFLSAAPPSAGGGCSLVVHRAEDGGCGAVAYEN